MNPADSDNPAIFSHNFGFYAPSSTTTAGADFVISPNLVATTRFGYYFDNYHDSGMPTGGNTWIWSVNGVGATDAFGNPLPGSLQEPGGYASAPNDIKYTSHNADKQIQLYQALNWVKSGWWGTHNFTFGYQLSRLSNTVLQHWNQPEVNIFPGATYAAGGPVGAANCAAVEAADGTSSCMGKYGYVTVMDYGSGGSAISYNHGLFAQDDWTIGKGLTLDLGLRVEKENLPAEDQPSGGISNPINFSWTQKVAPRLGAAWDVFQNGKMKVFGDYGVYYDVMKLNLAISSFGGQYWQNCAYALDTSNLSNIDPVFNSATRDCVGPDATSQANFPNGTTPAGLTFLENQNFRTFPTTCAPCTATEEGVAPGLDPYRQHESDLGIEMQLTPTLVFSARWDRRRIDHVIEDAAIYNPLIGETFVVVNPGQSINATYNGFFNFLYGTSSGCTATSTPSCPNLIQASRDYDGIEFQVKKTYGRNWTGMFSYTWSRLWGNYPGLTSSDISDGGGGRNAPNNSRSFDEPFFQFNDAGGSSNGYLNTDRPNTFKGYGYYTLNEGHHYSTDFGVFQFLYQGSPISSYADVGYSFAPAGNGGSGWGTYVVDRGKYVNVTQDPATGAITVGNPYTRRTPWFMDTDLNIRQTFKISEDKSLSFEATVTNLLNQHSVTGYNTQIETNYQANWLQPGGHSVFDGAAFYSAAMHPYNLANLLNTDSPTAGPMTINSQYGLPYLWQVSRAIRLGMRFEF